jgi:hypothetical protein
MHPEMPILIQLQNANNAIHDIKVRAAKLDKGQRERRFLEVRGKELEIAEADFKKNHRELTDSQLTLKQLEEKIKSVHQRLFGGNVSNPKELQALEKDEQMLNEHKGKLDERILTLMELTEKQQAALEKMRAEIAQVTERAQKLEAAYKQQILSLAKEMKQWETAKQEAEHRLSSPLLKRYESVAKEVGHLALVSVKRNACGGCRSIVAEWSLKRLQDEAELIRCENCGRLLYLEG